MKLGVIIVFHYYCIIVRRGREREREREKERERETSRVEHNSNCSPNRHFLRSKAAFSTVS